MRCDLSLSIYISVYIEIYYTRSCCLRSQICIDAFSTYLKPATLRIEAFKLFDSWLQFRIVACQGPAIYLSLPLYFSLALSLSLSLYITSFIGYLYRRLWADPTQSLTPSLSLFPPHTALMSPYVGEVPVLVRLVRHMRLPAASESLNARSVSWWAPLKMVWIDYEHVFYKMHTFKIILWSSLETHHLHSNCIPTMFLRWHNTFVMTGIPLN